MTTHSSFLAWRIPWTEEPGGLQSTESQELDTTERLNHHHLSVMGICFIPAFKELSYWVTGHLNKNFQLEPRECYVRSSNKVLLCINLGVWICPIT